MYSWKTAISLALIFSSLLLADNQKISELSAVTQLDKDDLLLVSEDNGDGTYTSKKLTLSAYANVFDVRLYGATGNGVTDDTAAIQAAIDAAKAAGGGTVYMPLGTYPISTTLDMTGTAYVNLIGDGMLASKIKPTFVTNIPAIEGGSAWTGSQSRGWSTIRDIGIDTGLTTYTFGKGIYWQSANPKLIIDHVYIKGLKYGIYTTSDWGSHYRDSYISYCEYGIYLGRQPNCVKIDSVYCQRCETGIYASEPYQLTIQNCQIERKTVYSIRIVGGGPVKIDGGYLEADLGGDYCIAATAKSGYALGSLQVSNIHVNSNSALVWAAGVQELSVFNNQMMTPPENHVVVIADSTDVGLPVANLLMYGNHIQNYPSSGYDTDLKKYLYRFVGSGTQPRTIDIGGNGDYTKKGTVYYGTLDQTIDVNIVDAYKEEFPRSIWEPTNRSGFTTDAQSDTGTVQMAVENNRKCLKLTHTSGTSWNAYRYTRTPSLANIRAFYGDTGNLRLRLRCWAKNAYIVCRGGASTGSSAARSGSWELIELNQTIDVASGTAYRLGYQVASGQTGYVTPIEVTLFGTDLYGREYTLTWDEPTVATHDYASGTTAWTMTTDEASCNHFVVTSAGGAADAVFPAAKQGKRFSIFNNSGAAITFKVTGQTGSAVATGKYADFTMSTTDCVELYEQP